MARSKKEVKDNTTKKAAAKTSPRGRKKSESQTEKSNSTVPSPLNFGSYFSSVRANFQKNRKLYSRYLIITGLVILIAAFAFWKKNWFVAAVVNNQPITTVELYSNLKAKNGQEVLDQIIRDKLITQEARVKGVNVSEEDINKKLGEVEKQVGGKDQLKQALETRNITEKDFKQQIKIQLLVEKLLDKEIQVSEQEIDDYLAKNPTEGQDPKNKATRDEVKSQLRNNKLNEKFQSWYSELEKKAKIAKFI